MTSPGHRGASVPLTISTETTDLTRWCTHGIARSGPQTSPDALLRVIATRRGHCSWTVDHAGWVVTLHSPEEQTFSGKTLDEAFAWCLVWLMAPELGIGSFLA
jgi:hypothetical protein